jgi:hypothetical protein
MPNKSVGDAVSKIRALRKLTQETGTITRRAQNAVLQALSPSDLGEVALMLDRDDRQQTDQ